MVYDDAELEADPALGSNFPTDPDQERDVQVGRVFFDTDGLH